MRLRYRKLTGWSLASLMLAGTIAPARAGRGDIGKDIERGLGKMVADELEASYGVVDDPLLTGWVDRLGQKLAAVSGRTDVKYRFRVLDSDDVNAVAAPGGYIYVNRGTLRFVKSEDELASVMGHEVGHVAGKHAMKQLTAQLLGTLALVGFQAAHAETLRTVGSLAGGLAMLKFGRDEENDADRRGLRNAVATGYDGEAMLSFFQRLQATEKDKPSALEVYFLTHPPTGERIRRVTNEPGAANSAANFEALGRGYEARSLYRQAASAYRRAVELDPENTGLKLRMAEAVRRAPALKPDKPLTSAQKVERLKQLAGFADDVEKARGRLSEDRKQWANSQAGADDELEGAARSLSTASQMISRRDVVQYREFVRMARAFDRATRAGGNLRAARDLMEETLAEMPRLVASIRTAVDRGDSEAGAQVDGLLMTGPALLKDLSEGTRAARGRAGDVREGVRGLRLAADSLLTSFRSPFGYTSGQFDILNLQVSSAQDTLSDTVTASRRALGMVAHARTALLVNRINFLTRSVRSGDMATAGIIAHYLGIPAEDVTERRAKLEFGDAALALADEQIEKYHAEKKKPRKDGDRSSEKDRDLARNESAADQSVREGLRWENAGVLFNLIAQDLERETLRA